MTPEDPTVDPSPEAEAELAEHEAVKDDEVMEREGVEQELMQSGQSEVGEELENVEETVDE